MIQILRTAYKRTGLNPNPGKRGGCYNRNKKAGESKQAMAVLILMRCTFTGFSFSFKTGRALWRRGGKGNESLQLRLWNFNSTSNFPVAPRRLSCQISANQREEETSANVSKHWKTRAKGNDVITNVISANQHFASTFSMHRFSNSRHVNESFISFSRPGELARRLTGRGLIIGCTFCLQVDGPVTGRAWKWEGGSL